MCHVHKYFDNMGIEHHVSCPHTHQHNGSIDRKHRHIFETFLSLLAQAYMPVTFSDEAFSTATFLINRLPTRVIDNATPLERLLGNKAKPNYNMLKAFGCACFPYLHPYNAKKLMFRSKECVFIGYSEHHKGYKCLDTSTGRVYISRDVVFDETSFPFAKKYDVTLHPPNYNDLLPTTDSGICTNITNDPLGPMQSRAVFVPAGPLMTAPGCAARHAPDQVDRTGSHAHGHADSANGSPGTSSPQGSDLGPDPPSPTHGGHGSAGSQQQGDVSSAMSSASSSATTSTPPATSSPAPPDRHPMVTRLRDNTWKQLKRTDGTDVHCSMCT